MEMRSGSTVRLSGVRNTSNVSQRDEQPWMANLTDGGRRRDAPDHSERTVISVISSNGSPTLPSPPQLRCTHRHKPRPRILALAALWTSLLRKKFWLWWFSLHTRHRAEHSRALPASPPPPERAALCAYRRDTKLGLVLMSNMILPVTLNETLFPLCWDKPAIFNFLKRLKPQRQAVLHKMTKHDKYNFRWAYITILHWWVFV